ncbi:hypothetical protein RclHR1_20070001 [Rhizophagus clarus]|uniref:Uncharacterized protein n=1 Tax=Rhizophagus clarus TaxID=94130 RepID=A0A2Z6R435_9GLOM|nr:hypothetical protein RclHR1_20070001 [Rhizophagus clarus]GES74919.1 hypothetical protein GLOIN_2v1593406 [Rhizophagus clarus]
MQRNPFNFLRNQVQQYKVRKLARECNLTPLTLPQAFQDPILASRILKITKNYIDMPALVIQWNDAGFNDDATSPGNRNGVVGQDRNAIINHLIAGGATNHHDTIFVFKNGQSVGDCEDTLPNWVRHQAGIPDVVISCYRINRLTAGGLIDVEIYNNVFKR